MKYIFNLFCLFVICVATTSCSKNDNTRSLYKNTISSDSTDSMYKSVGTYTPSKKSSASSYHYSSPRRSYSRSSVHVKGYHKRDGTYVKSHRRSSSRRR